jgi:8-oxo-dGTP diphosphatase
MIISDEGALEWIDDDKLADLNLWEGDKHFLKWLDEDKLFSAKFVYDKGRLTGYDVSFY